MREFQFYFRFFWIYTVRNVYYIHRLCHVNSACVPGVAPAGSPPKKAMNSNYVLHSIQSHHSRQTLLWCSLFRNSTENKSLLRELTRKKSIRGVEIIAQFPFFLAKTRTKLSPTTEESVYSLQRCLHVHH